MLAENEWPQGQRCLFGLERKTWAVIWILTRGISHIDIPQLELCANLYCKHYLLHALVSLCE